MTYAEMKRAQIDSALAKVSADDDPEAHELARDFCAEYGVTDVIGIHRLAWSIMGYGDRRAMMARKTGK